MRGLALLAVFLGCNPAFDIGVTDLEPAGPGLTDTDGDTVVDLEDNCPSDANLSQRDEDEDGIGDACDNCPVVANPNQETAGDTDDVGDHCDPRPTSVGDCLVLFESFDEDTFATRWHVYANSPTPPGVTAIPGEVSFVPTDDQPVTIVARDNAGTILPGPHDVQAITRGLPSLGGHVSAATRSEGYRSGYTCGTQNFYSAAGIEITAGGYRDDGVNAYTSGPLFTEATGQVGLWRLHVPQGSDPRDVRCRVELGTAAGNIEMFADPMYAPPLVGGSGIRMVQDPFTVLAVALYQVSATCPTPIRR